MYLNLTVDIYRVAGIGSLDPGQVPDICIKYIHLLHQAGQSSLCGLSHLLIHTFRLQTHPDILALQTSQNLCSVIYITEKSLPN